MLSQENGIEKKDNSNMCNQLREWALENLERLAIALISNKINNLLKPVIEQNQGFAQACKLN